MKQNIKQTVFASLMLFGLVAVPLLPAAQASAAPAPKECVGVACARNGALKAQTGDDSSNSLSEVIKIVTNILLFVLGAIAVIMIVIGGIKYTISNGDSAQIKSAKDTILYSVIGLVLAIMAYAIVGFVIAQFIEPAKP